MKIFHLLLFFGLTVIVIYIILINNLNFYEIGNYNFTTESKINDLHNLILKQNKTISDLKELLLNNNSFQNSKKKNLIENSNYYKNSDNFVKKIKFKHKINDACESQYGSSLIKRWRNTAETWCIDKEVSNINFDDIANITCYPFIQDHRKRNGPNKADVFCEAHNIYIDFSKISGEPQSKKIRNGNNYLNYEKGAIFSTCKKTELYQQKKTLLGKHYGNFMNNFKDKNESPIENEKIEKNKKDIDFISTTTYLLIRDEDCENAFHSHADFLNMFLIMSILNINPHDINNNGGQQVLLFDRHINGPFFELIQQAFSPLNLIKRISDYKSKIILFKHLVFHLESPAALIFPKVSNPGPLRCYNTGLFQSYRKYILYSFNLLNVTPPPIPKIILTIRQRTKDKNVGRIMTNLEEVKKVINEGNMIDFQIIDQATMSFSQQLQLIRSSNILVGIHGAGLMFIMYAAEEAILIEIHPTYRQDRHFRHASRMTGKIYMPLRATTQETCEGSSDNIMVPIPEFKQTLDGAIRLARNFDNGLSECGLTCSPKILAMDSHLDSYYKKNEKRVIKPYLHFPCG